MEKLELTLTGLTPILMHNVRRFLNAGDEAGREFKTLGKKRNKTEEDFQRMSDLEFVMGMYADELGRPILPGEILEACVIAGAKKSKAGNIAKTSLLVEDAPLIYDGPATADELLADPNFRDVRPVDVNGARINRTRPIFRNWSARITMSFDPGLADKGQVLTWVRDAGAQCGIGDFRPRFGRFAVE